jgi:hypothetical protein
VRVYQCSHDDKTLVGYYFVLISYQVGHFVVVVLLVFSVMKLEASYSIVQTPYSVFTLYFSAVTPLLVEETFLPESCVSGHYS